MENKIVNIFEKTYEQESDAIFRFCLVRVSNREQALDITQETFLRFWTALSKEENILNNRAFLFTIAHRLIIDWYRKKKSFSLDFMLSVENEGGYDVLDEKSTKDNSLLGAEGRFLLEKINSLDLTYRNPVYLRFVEDLSPQEIGEILGISSNAVSVRINRGIRELKKIAGYQNIEE